MKILKEKNSGLVTPPQQLKILNQGGFNGKAK